MSPSTAVVAGALANKAGQRRRSLGEAQLGARAGRFGFRVVFVEQIATPRPGAQADRYFRAVTRRFGHRRAALLDGGGRLARRVVRGVLACDTRRRGLRQPEREPSRPRARQGIATEGLRRSRSRLYAVLARRWHRRWPTGSRFLRHGRRPHRSAGLLGTVLGHRLASDDPPVVLARWPVVATVADVSRPLPVGVVRTDVSSTTVRSSARRLTSSAAFASFRSAAPFVFELALASIRRTLTTKRTS